ncbi:DUF1801 domain-containing protein [Flavobacteriaceae bacterium GSB9]|nr:DUF1801 domain-containing protein [Flavobacteriaceae bacterium GSB9]
MALQCGLTEESKWGMPYYTFNNKNVLMVSAFKHYCAISFFKGALLNDTKNILEKPGENSQAVRLIKFTSSERIKKLKNDIKNAFEALTPGRQRGYILYFSAPKQSKTRVSRIEKCCGKILNDEGLHDKYKGWKR